MYVIAEHRVKDQEAFFADVPSVAQNAPDGVQPHQFCPSEDGSTAVCLWEADSVEAVRAYLDRITEGVAENTYFEVDLDHAIGLPESSQARAR